MTDLLQRTLSVDPNGRYHPFPMTETQQALMIGRGDAVEFGNIGCHGYFEWERDDLDAERFATAWRRLVDRHDMLRTVARPDGTQQVLADPGDYRIPVRRLAALPPDRQLNELAAIRAEMSHAVFPVGSWPLFDLRITELADGVSRIHLGIDLQVLDASSAFQVLFPDLVDLYEHPETELADPGLGFRDYAIWRRQELPHTEAYQRARAYWLDRVPQLPPAPGLPAGTSQPGPVRFDRRERRLPQQHTACLAELAAEHGLTLSTLLTAAFAEVVRDWSDTPDFTINYPVFHRPGVHPGIGRVLGDFTNAVLLTARSTGDTFLDRARALHRQIELDTEHGEFNGIEVLRELTRVHGAGMQAAMPVVVTSLLDYPTRRPVSDLGREVYSISQTPQVSLDVQLRELDDELRVIWDFVDGAFAPGLLDAMFAAYGALLDLLAEDRDVWHTDRFNLIPADQQALRLSVNATDGEVRDALLHELLSAQITRTPEAEAVVDSRRRLSYAELGGYANRIARRLRAAGARPGELVAVVMEKGWEQYAAVYGILASGAAYLPLDATVPAERLHRLLAGGQVRTVLTQARLDQKLDWPAGVVRHRVDEDFETGDTTALPTVQRQTDPAYVIYTSGSTGEPKGVVVDHRGVVNLIDDVNSRFQVTAADRLLAISGLHFDASVYDVFGVLAVGGTVVLPDQFEQAEPDAWADRVAAESITVWNSVPVLMELLVGEAETRTDRPLASLRLAVLSGDWIPLTLPARMRAQSTRLRVVGSGGPTETICWSLFQPIGEVDPAWASIPYGTPITNQAYHILDEELRERPIGVPGQMVVASEVGLAHGYWRDPERTAAKFVRLPGSGRRAYLTGDLGRYLPGGSIEILGRDDFQVKIQGQRVELGEIEAALRQDPGVRAAVVVAPRSEHGVRRLHGFLVTADGCSADEIRSRLAQRLPKHLVPSGWTVLDTLPLTRNGKVDRLALVESAGRQPDRAPAPTEGGPLEQVVCAAAAQILGLDDAVPADNFFRLGGDSLSGTRLASLLRELLGVPIPIRTVFGHPVLGELAARLAADEAIGGQAVSAAEALSRLA
ncbi:pyochelin synthetase [Kitasatospora sp. GP30]|nr:pyochelin synthetase [Kitasatospora sp. GP30]